MKRVTIYEVAQTADVSLATVSRVINGSTVVKKETRDKVEAAINKLGYKPNAIAQGLALQKTTSIGFLIPETSFSYTGQIINGILDVAKIYNFKVYIHTMADGISDISTFIDDIIKARVDGVIIYNDRVMEDHLTELSSYNLPIVLVNNKASGEGISCVYVDVEKAVYELVSKYLDKGVKDIAILDDRKSQYSISQVLKGCEKAFKEHNLDFKNFIKIPHEYRSSYKFLKEYLSKEKHELIITNRDSQAMAVINASNENEISVPHDMEVVCIIDTKYNSMIRPEISSFTIPSYDLGALSMRVMTKMLNEEEIVEKVKKLSYLYNERGSTK